MKWNLRKVLALSAALVLIGGAGLVCQCAERESNL